MIAKTIWKKEMEFDGYSESGHKLVFDAGAAHANGPSPMEAVLMALCACTSVDVVSILRKEARASDEPYGICNRGTGRCAASCLHKDQADLPDWRCCLKEGRRRRSRTLEE